MSAYSDWPAQGSFTNNTDATTPSGAGFRSEGDSDSISALIMKKKGTGRNGRKKGTSGLSSREKYKTIPEPPIPDVLNTANTPSNAFHVAVTSSTGFSPLNPTVSLSDAFVNVRINSDNYQDAVSTPPPVARVHTPTVLSPIPDTPATPVVFPVPEMPMPDTPVIPVFSPVPEMSMPITPATPVFSPVPPTPVFSRPSYRELRPQLFQDAFFASVNGAKFNDTEIHVFSARTRSGVAHKPRVLRARSTFLQAASTKFQDELYGLCTVRGTKKVGSRCSRVTYRYDEDSDLEDCEEDIHEYVEPVARNNNIPGAQATMIATASTATTTLFRDDVAKPSPSASDGEILSLDGGQSESGLSDLIQEAREQVRDGEFYKERPPTAARTPSRPALTLQTSSPVLREEFKTPEMVPVVLDDRSAVDLQQVPVSPVATKREVPVDTGSHERILFIQDSAHRTWQALLLYLYNDYLSFSSLRSENVSQSDLKGSQPQCSPKSMYRLADKLGLVDLQKSAFEAIERSLSKKNIVKELFSDFTWRYPEVLRMETDIFYRYASEPVVQAAMSETFQDIAYGQLPHSSVVLDSLFKKFASLTPRA